MDLDSHKELLECILELKGKVMLSGYPSDLYDSKLYGWNKRVFTLPNNAAGGDNKRKMKEVVWMNY
jgi:DNA adenine methylase